jgi:hypothetical protein
VQVFRQADNDISIDGQIIENITSATLKSIEAQEVELAYGKHCQVGLTVHFQLDGSASGILCKT